MTTYLEIQQYVMALTDEQLKENTTTAIKDMGEAAEADRYSEWHQSCFAAVAVYADELKRRGISLPNAIGHAPGEKGTANE